MRPNPLIPTRMAIAVFVSLLSGPVATRGRPSERDVAEDASAGGEQHVGARVEGRGGGDDVVHEYDMGAAKRRARALRRTKRAGNIARPLRGCQPCLRLRRTRALD